MKVGIVIPDGTGIRNYLFSDLVEELQALDCEIVIFHSVSDAAIREIEQRHQQEFQLVNIPIYFETPLQKFYRELICYTRLLFNASLVDNSSMLKYWNPRKRGLKNRLFYGLVEFFGRRAQRSYSKILNYEKAYDKRIVKSSLNHQGLLRELQPDVLFSTHQRAMNAVPLIKAAKMMGIPTVGAVFSWDNLPKARLTVRTDSYVVWSKHMKTELYSFYPEITPDKIKITGTPQFEFYKKNELAMSKLEFCKAYGLDSSKFLLCFSGDDELTSPFDPKYLEDLAERIDAANLNMQIVLRRAPVDLSGRFDALIERYPELIKPIDPLWTTQTKDKKQWQTIFPKYEDVRLLVNTVGHCDAVINLGSTMALDFAIYGKPAVYLNYNPVTSSHWSVETIYKYQHFRSMHGLNPVYWLTSKAETLQVLKKLMVKQHTLDNEKWLDKIAEHRDASSKAIAKYLRSCI